MFFEGGLSLTKKASQRNDVIKTRRRSTCAESLMTSTQLQNKVVERIKRMSVVPSA